MSHPSQSELVRLISYDAISGDFRWRVSPSRNIKIGSEAGTINREGYRVIQIGRKKFLGHRIAWIYMFGENPSTLVDHINGCRSDNRLKNLRLSDQMHQSFNQSIRKNNTSGFKGVHTCGKKFTSSIRCGQKRAIWLGTFDSADEAAHAYNKAAIVLHGEFARLNPVGHRHDQKGKQYDH